MSNSEINEEAAPYYVQCSIEGCSEWVPLSSLTQHEDNCTYLKKKNVPTATIKFVLEIWKIILKMIVME